MERQNSRGSLRSMVLILAAITPVFAQMPGRAHRPHEEYLQATSLSMEQDSVHALIALTANADAFPMVMADIDTDGDGDFSPAEELAYAAMIVRDAWIAVDGNRVLPRVVSMKFPTVQELKEGTGEILLQLRAALPSGDATRTLTFDNRHENGIGVYRVELLPSTDPSIRFVGQHRNERQSFLELEYQQTGVRSQSGAAAQLSAFGPSLLGCLLGWIAVTVLKPVARRMA